MPVHMIACSDLIDDRLLASYEDLPADRYLNGDHTYRYRAFGETLLTSGASGWSLGTPFFQSRRLNGYAGGISRAFAPLAEPAREFSHALAVRARERGIVPSGELSLGCHQIRVVATDDSAGPPTPEGFHQDGFSWVLIACVARDNASGAVTSVRRVDAPSAPLFEGPLAVGDALLLEDPLVEHYVSPLTPRRTGRAHRDVVVVTLSPAATREAHGV